MPADIVSPLPAYTLREFKTPMSTKSANIVDADLVPHSAMKGVILTSTGEPVASPTQVQFAKLFVETLKVGLNFAKTFDFDAENESGHSDGELDEDGYETDSRRRAYKREKDRDSSDGESTPHPVNRQHVERDECDIDGRTGSPTGSHRYDRSPHYFGSAPPRCTICNRTGCRAIQSLFPPTPYMPTDVVYDLALREESRSPFGRRICCGSGPPSR